MILTSLVPRPRPRAATGLALGSALIGCLALSACTFDDPGADAPDLSTTDSALRCVPSNNRYNCEPPRTSNRKGPRVIHSKRTGSINWPVFSNTPLYDGMGTQVAVVTGSTVHINYGQRKRLDGQTLVYAWAVRTNLGAKSGWIPEAQIKNPSLLDRRSPTLRLPNPGHGTYTAIWTITGGNPGSIANLKVNPRVSSGQNGTDYLVRPGNIVNIVYTVPGFSLGGYSVDTVPVGTIFRRARGVKEIDIPLYRPNSSTKAHVNMHFIYGYINDGHQRRYGWMAKEAMTITGWDK